MHCGGVGVPGARQHGMGGFGLNQDVISSGKLPPPPRPPHPRISLGPSWALSPLLLGHLDCEGHRGRALPCFPPCVVVKVFLVLDKTHLTGP